MIVTTRIDLRVAGRAREVSLGARAARRDTKPLSLTSESAGAARRATATLRLQVRAGTYRVEIDARSEGSLDSVRLSQGRLRLARLSEVWVWQADEALRQVELSGAPAVDPGAHRARRRLAQRCPRSSLREGDALALATARRGEPSPPPNRLQLAARTVARPRRRAATPCATSCRPSCIKASDSICCRASSATSRPTAKTC